VIKIRGYDVDVNVEEELRMFDWVSATWKEDRLICCSPFRDEVHPSFAVHLDTGVFIDSGGDGEWRKGHFVKLLSWLRNETWTETQEYLLEKYFQLYFKDTDSLELNFDGWVTKKKEEVILPDETLQQFAYRHPYLERVRGIEDKYQRALKIGYDNEKQAIAIPHYDKDKRLINIKFRAVKDKRFWYYHTGQPVGQHLWGLWLVILKGWKRVFLVESEIDAMTLLKNGIPAIAVCGSQMTRRQRSLILEHSGIDTLVLATDNDKAGRRLKESIVQSLNGLIELEEMWFPEWYKDVNDIPTNELLKYTCNTKAISFKFL
jgi:5S rRNA maturation endonuclease (ribonuclease M5)